jgi:hypothetical protein
MESDMTDTDFATFGMSQADIRDQYINGITAKLVGQEMVVMGILSDCQELISLKGTDFMQDTIKERVRKQMNIAKFILGEMMQKSA